MEKVYSVISTIGWGSAILGGAIIGIGYLLESDKVKMIGAMTSIIGLGTHLMIGHEHKIYLLGEQTKELREIRLQNESILKELQSSKLEDTVYFKEK